jgi:hypothetical protein
VGDLPVRGGAAWYAASPGTWRDWVTILHPPYTTWHLAYVAIGASLASHLDERRLVATLLAFFAAVGVAAHALDELHGRPLRTRIPHAALVVASVVGLVVAVGLGVAGLDQVGLALLPFILVGPMLVVGYNLELFGGWLHNDLGFALAWGAFPTLTGYVAQTNRLSFVAAIGALGALALSLAQRRLSTPARLLRRHAIDVVGTITLDDGGIQLLDQQALLAPLERALRALSWGIPTLAAALVVARLV